jgi:hypothetical protein
LGLSARDSISIFHFVAARYTQEDEHFKTEYDSILNDYTRKVRAILPN